MIAETIKLLQSNSWYGCNEIIEIAKGKNAVPKTWKEAKEKIRRRKYMEADKGRKTLLGLFKYVALKFNKIRLWLSQRK